MDEDGRIRILVVEDNPTQANLMRISLTRRGFDVSSVTSLAEAFERLHAGGIEVILLDLSLPDSQGIQTFYNIYSRASHIPIVVLTGLNDQKVAYEALKSGAQDYLIKGIPSDESVVRCLRYAIQRHQFETELWQRERRIRLILENARDAFFSIDAGTIVTFWNARAESMFGYLRKDALGRPLSQLIVPVRYRSDFEQELQLFARGRRGSLVNNRVQLELRHRDGHEIPVELTLFPIQEDSGFTFCAFVRDVSESVGGNDVAENQLQWRIVSRLAELERQNNQLEKYAHALSADFHKPVDLIDQHTAQLRKHLPLDEAGEEHLRNIEFQVQKLKALIGQFSEEEAPVGWRPANTRAPESWT